MTGRVVAVTLVSRNASREGLRGGLKSKITNNRVTPTYRKAWVLNVLFLLSCVPDEVNSGGIICLSQINFHMGECLQRIA